jgi:ADP-heptose:LPS heptosyltransferase
VKRKLILKNFLSPGDLVMLTAAVRDLHRLYPGKFLTDVRSSCPELWEHNPYLTPLLETDPGVEQIECHYPLIDRSNEAPVHCIHGFTDFLSAQLGMEVRPTLFQGDIHLSAEEQRWKSTVHELAGRDLPFWIINAGGKFDFTIKWWDWQRYQRVIDHFRGKILFVQVGEIGHYHPPLRDIVDLRGRLDLRQLVRLTYHAQGVLCGVTALMHLAAAVPRRPDRPSARAAVVVAGGREPTHWEAYPQHQFIHTIGALPCCQQGGCWRARTHALGDGETMDNPNQLCLHVRNNLPRCMDMITADEVVRRIQAYFEGGNNRFLTSSEQRAAERAIQRSQVGPRFESTINLGSVRTAVDGAAHEAGREEAPAMEGRGIILLVDTDEEWPDALGGVRSIRAHGCELPIQCWHRAVPERQVSSILRTLGATLVNSARTGRVPAPLTRAELRLHALRHVAWREVLVLKPSTFLLRNPDKLFQRLSAADSGAVIFHGRPNQARAGVWKLCGLEVPSITASSSPVLIDRERCWGALQLWRWALNHMYFFNGYLDGEGGVAQFAFARMGSPLKLSRPSRSFWTDASGTTPPEVVTKHRRAAVRVPRS